MRVAGVAVLFQPLLQAVLVALGAVGLVEAMMEMALLELLIQAVVEVEVLALLLVLAVAVS
jgi:hypothetical protein